MDRSTPSFLRLFRRSHYVQSVQLDDDSSEAEAKRQERERFAVAALAFCLKHDPVFLVHFWQTICRVANDPSTMPPIRPEDILLEPPHWADLRLASDENGQRYVWVIEVKTGAPLDKRQRPDCPEVFMRKGYGYGALFSSAEKDRGTKMRFIVLGANSEDNLDISNSGAACGPIAVQQRNWADLLPPWRNPLLNDLFETLGELGINPFYMEKIKSLSVTNGLSNVGHAWKILTTVCSQLGIRPGYWSFEPETSDDGGGHAGIYIKLPPEKKSPSTAHRRLHAVTRMQTDYLAWFGYEHDTHGNTAKSVWIYSGGPDVQKKLAAKLKPVFPLVREETTNGDYCVVVAPADGDACLGDLEWFLRVFENVNKR